MTYDIFISYRRSDRELVAAVVHRLEARGVGVWYDADIEGGADWRETIVAALTSSDMLAIFFSEDCNNSRQLKKELAVADSLGKPVVPILIENAQPRGAYLYELADRNWIPAWPEPMERIDELVEHLATLAGKSAGGLAGVAHSKLAAPVKFEMVSPPAANDGIPAPAANDDVAEREQPLDEAVGEFIHGTDRSAKAAPKIAKAYVGRVGAGGGPIREHNDILPFRWIDLLLLAPMLSAFAYWLNFIEGGPPLSGHDVAGTTVITIAAVAGYGSLVFPVRYFLRRRPALSALGKYLISSAILFALLMGVLLGTRAAGIMKLDDDDVGKTAEVFSAAWLAFTVIAFLVYGALSGQRAIRSFRSNIRKL